MTYADLESLIKGINNCKNYPEKYSTTKIVEHIFCGFWMSAVWAFDNIENKHSLYRGKYFMKTFSISLEENAANVIHFEKKKDFTSDAKRAKTSSRFNCMLHF